MLVYAHRGASWEKPQNSLAAVVRAAELGADGVEVDIQRCGTGELVVFHDYDLARFGVAGQVSELGLSDLRRLDLGSGERIPTLDELFEAAPRGLLLNVELKTERIRTRSLEAQVVRAIRRHGRDESVVVSSFNPLSLLRVRRLAPRLCTAFLFHRGQSLPWREGWPRLLRPAALHPHHSLVDASFMARARAGGFFVAPYTVDTPDEIRRLAALGVGAVISNRPERVLALRQKSKASLPM